MLKINKFCALLHQQIMFLITILVTLKQPNEKDSPAKLELFLEPNDVDTFQNCDNLTIAPWGDVIICEDKHDPRIIGITPKGKTYVIAKNIGYRQSEFAGPVFSRSGKTLFVNIQSPGLTLAITGPWKSN